MDTEKETKKKGKLSIGVKILIAFWVLFFAGIFTVYKVFDLIADGKIGYLPPVEELLNPKSKFATEVYSCDMKVLGRYFQQGENRLYTPYSELPPYLVDALISTEDARYYSHSGIDGDALFRVAIKTLVMHKDAGGGSTISQQLAKLLFTKKPKTGIERAKQKLTEWVVAAKLEKYYTKEEIITMYLNKFDFVNNAVGIKSASQIYFSKQPNQLSKEEAAVFVGMLQNPAKYNPRRFSEKCKCRRNIVLSQMVKYDKLSQAECDSLSQLDIQLKFQNVDHKQGPAPYFREYLRSIMTAPRPDYKKYPKWMHQKYYEDSLAWETNPLYGWCNKNLKPDGTPYDLYTDGLKIYTTLDSRMQQYAEEAIKEYVGGYLQPIFHKEKFNGKHKKAPFSNKSTQAQVDSILAKAMRASERYRAMKYDQKMKSADIKAYFDTAKIAMRVFDWEKGSKDTVLTPMDSIRYAKSFLRSALMSIDPFNGHVKAYVGGIDYNYFQYDMVCVGRRQVGSTIKPFLYSLAMEEGHSPCDSVPNVQPQVLLPSGEIWEPRNVPYGEEGKKEIGKMITIRRGLQTSNNWTSAYLIKQLGPESFVKLLHSFGLKNYIDPVPSLCLGIADVSVCEMTSAYTAFANKGIRTEPLFVTRIEDNQGNVISTFIPRMNEVFSEQTAYKMISMLQGVINGGTGLRLRTRRYDYSIGWDTPVAGKTGTTQNNSDGWFMGFVPNLITGVWVGGEDRDIHFDSIKNGQGSASALPVWGTYMNKVYKDESLGYSRTEPFIVTDKYTCSKADERQKTEGEEIPEMILFE